jgi:hypothetical protein
MAPAVVGVSLTSEAWLVIVKCLYMYLYIMFLYFLVVYIYVYVVIFILIYIYIYIYTFLTAQWYAPHREVLYEE